MFTTTPHGFRRNLDPSDAADGGPVRTDIGFDYRVSNPTDPRRSWARAPSAEPPKPRAPAPPPVPVGVIATSTIASAGDTVEADDKRGGLAVVVVVLVATLAAILD